MYSGQTPCSLETSDMHAHAHRKAENNCIGVFLQEMSVSDLAEREAYSQRVDSLWPGELATIYYHKESSRG